MHSVHENTPHDAFFSSLIVFLFDPESTAEYLFTVMESRYTKIQKKILGLVQRIAIFVSLAAQRFCIQCN